MTTLTKFFISGHPSVPGRPRVPEGHRGYWLVEPTPSTPATPAWDESIFIQRANGSIYVGYDVHNQPFGFFVPDGTFTTLVEIVHHDALPGHAGTPGIWVVELIPGWGGSPSVPATLVDYYIGWNSSAISIGRLAADGYYQFRVPISTVGAITGFNDADEGSGYLEIDHGFFCAYGRVQVVENGLFQTIGDIFIEADVFTIARTGTQVKYYKNNDLIYTSALPSLGTVLVDASLYYGGDRIIDARLVDGFSDAPEFGGTSGTVSDYIELFSIGMNVAGGVVDSFDLDIIAVGATTGVVADNLDLVDAAGEYGVRDSLEVMSVDAESGLMVLDVRAVIDDLGEIFSFGLGLVGGLGDVADTLESIYSFSANYHCGVVVDTLEPLQVFAADESTMLSWGLAAGYGVFTDETTETDASEDSEAVVVTLLVEEGTFTSEVSEAPEDWVTETGVFITPLDADAPIDYVWEHGTFNLPGSYDPVGEDGPGITSGESSALIEYGFFTDSYEEDPFYLTVEYGVFSSETESHALFHNDIGEQGTFANDFDLSQHDDVVVSGSFGLSTELVVSSDIELHGTLHSSVSLDTSFENNTTEHGVLLDVTVSQFADEAFGTGVFTEDFAIGAVTSEPVVEFALFESTTLTVNTTSSMAATAGAFIDEITGGFGNDVVEEGAFTDVVNNVSTLVDLAVEAGAFTDELDSLTVATTETIEYGTFTTSVYTILAAALSTVVEQGYFTDETQGGGAAGAWTAHLETFAMSRYTNFPFTSMALVDGVLLGTTGQGVYRLDADTDAGVAIDARVVHDWSDDVPDRNGELHSNEYLKHARYLYVGTTATGRLGYSLGYVDAAGVEASATYSFLFATRPGYSTNRSSLGRGVRSRFLQSTMFNIDGADFAVNDATLVVELSNRRM